MACADTLRDRVIDLASGRLRGPQRWMLAIHLRRCPECRALRADASALWAQLAAMASEPASPGLDARIYQALGVPSGPPPPDASAQRKHVPLRALVAVCVLVLLALAGVAVARRPAMRPRPPLRLGSVQFGRPTIRVGGDYHGLVELLELDGRSRTSVLQTSHRPSGGACVVEVDGRATTYRQPGTYPIRDGRGKPVAYLHLGPNGPDAQLLYETAELRKLGVKQTPSTIREARALRSAAMGRFWNTWGSAPRPEHLVVGQSSAGSMGYLASFDLYWKVSGYAGVSVQSSAGSMVVGGRVPSRPRPYVPEISVIYRGKTVRARGWGCHHVVDAKGRVLADLWVVERSGGGWQQPPYFYSPPPGARVPALPLALTPNLPHLPAR